MTNVFILLFRSLGVYILLQCCGVEAQVDYTSALLWTSQSKEEGATVWSLVSFFGNPEVYVPIVQTNGSAPQNYDWSNIYIDDTFVFTAVAADYRTHYAYFCLANIPVLAESMAIYFNQTQIASLDAANISSNVKGLALDWISKNLYWSDAGPPSQKIGMISLINKNFYRPVVSSGLTSLGDISVDPNAGYLFWCDGQFIWRSNLNGDLKTNLVPFYLQQPASLSLDFAQQRIYYYDTVLQKHGHLKYDGTSFYLHSTITPGISAITFFKGYLFLASQTTNEIRVMNASTSALTTSLFISYFFGGFNDIETFAAEAQPVGSSPCYSTNGGCDHFCLTTNNGTRTCQCALGYYLQNDGTTCGLTAPPQTTTTTQQPTILTETSTIKNTEGSTIQNSNKSATLSGLYHQTFLYYMIGGVFMWSVFCHGFAFKI